MQKCVNLDNKTIELIEKYGEARGLSFSASLRLVTNEFFIKIINQEAQ